MDPGAGARDKEEKGFLPRDQRVLSMMATPPSSPEVNPGVLDVSHSQAEMGTRKKRGAVVRDCSPWRIGRRQTKRQSREQGDAFAEVKLQRGPALEGREKP